MQLSGSAHAGYVSHSLILGFQTGPCALVQYKWSGLSLGLACRFLSWSKLLHPEEDILYSILNPTWENLTKAEYG